MLLATVVLRNKLVNSIKYRSHHISNQITIVFWSNTSVAWAVIPRETKHSYLQTLIVSKTFARLDCSELWASFPQLRPRRQNNLRVLRVLHWPQCQEVQPEPNGIQIKQGNPNQHEPRGNRTQKRKISTSIVSTSTNMIRELTQERLKNHAVQQIVSHIGFTDRVLHVKHVQISE